MKTLAILGTTYGTGNTTLAYHIICMLAASGKRIIAADLDRGTALSSMLLKTEDDYDLYNKVAFRQSLTESSQLYRDAVNDLFSPEVIKINENLFLFNPTELQLQRNDETKESSDNPKALTSSVLKKISSFSMKLRLAGESENADFCIIDAGSAANIYAILSSADYILVSLRTDSDQLKDLSALGRQIQNGKTELDSFSKNSAHDTTFHTQASLLGYVILQQKVDNPVSFNSQPAWQNEIPKAFYSCVLNRNDAPGSFEEDPFCLALLKFNPGLMYLASKAGKPMFSLKPADGAIGTHVTAVMQTKTDYTALTGKILSIIS